jgi:hypothetical protein
MILRSMRLDVCTSDDEKGTFFGLQKIEVPRVSGSTQVSGDQKAHFLAEGFYI